MLALQARIRGGGACESPGSALVDRARRRAADEAPGGPCWPRGLRAPFRRAPPARTGTSLGGSCAAGCGRRKWVAA
eukprot:5461144-Alexandrium_andersonii.AAC.1